MRDEDIRKKVVKFDKKYIYKITNKINRKSYIGQTNDCRRRFYEHRNLIGEKKNGLYTCILYRAIEKYGIDNFSFDILEYCEDYNDKEIYYIKLYDTVKNGYNILHGGDNPPLICGEDSNLSSHTKEEIDLLIWDIKNTDLSFQDIASKFHYDNVGSISRINCGSMWKQKSEKYPLRKVYLTQDLIDEIKYTDDYQQKIADDIGVSRSTVTMINIGQNNYKETIKYPIRNKK